MATSPRHARTALFAVVVCGFVAALATVETQTADLKVRSTSSQPPSGARAMLDTYCVACHNQRLKTAGLALDAVDATAPHANPEIWERGFRGRSRMGNSVMGALTSFGVGLALTAIGVEAADPVRLGVIGAGLGAGAGIKKALSNPTTPSDTV